MKATNEIDERTITIKRAFKAPVKTVWEAWTHPEHIANWWGPQGMETKVVEHDFRVGGRWKYTMQMPDGNEFLSFGIYSLIVELEKVCTSANFIPMTEGVEIQALFEGDGNQTHFTFNIVHPTKAYRDQQEKMGVYKGWGSVLDRLETVLTTMEK